MEHHWSNLNLNQAYGRLQSPANAASLNRFDLHLLEQQGFATAGLGAAAAAGLSSPLPAHATLSPAAARTFTAGLPHVNYSALPMAPLFDSVAHLTQGFAASQSPYRTAMQGVSAQPMYTIDTSGHPVSSAARFASIVAASAVVSDAQQPKQVSLFNTDPHTMADPVVSALSGITSQSSSASSSTQASWGHAPSHTAPANPYAGIPTDFGSSASAANRYTTKVVGVSAGEPPPAHSGSRPNMAVRTPSYQTKEYAPPAPQQRTAQQQPQTNAAGREPPRAGTIYTPTEPHRVIDSNPPTAHSNVLQRPGDDLMQKLLQTYNQQRGLVDRGQVPTAGVRTVPVSSFVSAPVAQVPQSTALIGRVSTQNYVDPRGQRVYTAYGIGSPIGYPAPTAYGAPSGDDVMEDIGYDDVSSPEGIGLQENVNAAAAGGIAGVYQHAGANVTIGKVAGIVVGHQPGIQNDDAVRHVIQTAHRPPSAALGRAAAAAASDPTIQAQADSTTKPKKGSGGGRGARATLTDSGSERGGKRSRSGSGRSRAKGKPSEDEGIASVAHVRAPEMNIPDLSSYGATAYAQLLPADFGSAGQGYINAETFSQYRSLTGDPYQVSAAECMLAASSRPDMTTHHRLTIGQSDCTVRTDQAVVSSQQQQQQEAQVFMTNMFGSAFVNPNELLAVEQITFVDPSADNATAGYAIQAVQKPPEPKPQAIIDEEFGHLAADPTAGSVHVAGATAVATNYQAPATVMPSASENNKPVTDAKPVNAFLSSFLNFVQGKKPETLQSVSTSVMAKKPVLPKYIPEPPRPKPPPQPPAATTLSPTSADATKAKAAAVPDKRKDSVVVHFSDDDDDLPLSKRASANITSTVNKVLSTLGDDSGRASGIQPARRGRPAKNSQTVGTHLPIQPLGLAKSATSKSAATNHPATATKRAAGSAQKSATKSATPLPAKASRQKKGSKHKLTAKSRSIDGGVVSDDDDYDDGDVVVMETGPVPPRERSTRRAKEKAVEQNRRASTQKGKRGVAIIFDSDSEAMSPDDVEPDSDRDMERDYDSDKDPAWKPHTAAAQPLVKRISVTLSSDSEEEGSSKAGHAKAVKGSVRGGKLPMVSPVKTQSLKTITQTSTVIVRSDKVTEPETVTMLAAPAMAVTSGDGSVMEMDTTETCEKKVDDDDGHGVLLNNTDVAEQEKVVPASASAGSSLAGAALSVDSFSVYVQILISQALEPTFFAALRQQLDPYYTDPLNEIDSVVNEKKVRIKSLHQWTPELVANLEKFAEVDVELVTTDNYSEATNNRNDRAAARIYFFGTAYEPETLEVTLKVGRSSGPVFLVTERESKILSIYHGLHHAKFALLSKCNAKVALLKAELADLPDDQLLDRCLRDQLWMQQMLCKLTDILTMADQFLAS